MLHSNLGYNSKILVNFVNKKDKAVIWLLSSLCINHFKLQGGFSVWSGMVTHKVQNPHRTYQQGSLGHNLFIAGLLEPRTMGDTFPTLSTKFWRAGKGPCPAQLHHLPPTFPLKEDPGQKRDARFCLRALLGTNSGGR